MKNEEGLKLQAGDMVWTCGAYESLYMPYRILEASYQEGKNVFALIVSESRWNNPNDRGERMNVLYLSHEHPLGWKFIKPEEELT